jgi:hypothetical protein
MKPFIGQKLNNGAVVTAFHKQYKSPSCGVYLVKAYWDTEPYTPFIVWEYNTNAPGHVFGGSYCKDEQQQTAAFIRRKMG